MQKKEQKRQFVNMFKLGVFAISFLTISPKFSDALKEIMRHVSP